jgi:hypothetical protein
MSSFEKNSIKRIREIRTFKIVNGKPEIVVTKEIVSEKIPLVLEAEIKLGDKVLGYYSVYEQIGPESF